MRCDDAAACTRVRFLELAIVVDGDTLVTVSGTGDASACAAVRWHPVNGAPLPRFVGRVWPEAETLCSSWLRLEGVYAFATASAADDVAERVADYRAARGVAKQLLDALARDITRSDAPGRP